MPAQNSHHKIVIVGGGSAGIAVAARLLNAGEKDVAVIDPAEVHYYQPLWTLVGGGRARAGQSARAEAAVMPPDATWIREAATEIDPDAQTVGLASGFLSVMTSWWCVRAWPWTGTGCPARRRPWARAVCPCAGAPQKIAYLAADWWRQQGVLSDIHVVLVLPTPKMFGVPEFSAVLEQVAARYGIDVRLEHEVVEVNPAAKEMVLVNRQGGGEEKSVLPYDIAHLVPPQSAPAWIKAGPLADPANPGGYVQIDKATMRHTRYGNVFSLGDAGREPAAAYDGYASCPLTTARNKMLLAEFDYTMKPHPTIPFINTKKERYDMGLLKRYGLPFLYWNLMLKGRV